MKLYEEILFLKHYFDGKFVVENVKPFYQVLIRPQAEIGRHLFWSNFRIAPIDAPEADIKNGNVVEWTALHGIDIKGYYFDQRRDKILRNCVNPELGSHIFNCSMNLQKAIPGTLF